MILGRITMAAAGTAGLVGAAGLVGCATGSRELASWGGATGMKAGTALALVVSAWAILGLRAPATRSTARTVALVAVATWGLAVLLEWTFDRSLGIDELLFADPAETAVPGRPSPQTTVMFIALAGALLSLDALGVRARRLHTTAAATFFALVTLAVLAHVYGSDGFAGHTELTGLAVPTIVAFVLLLVAAITLRPERAPVAWLAPGAVTAPLLRRLLPGAILLPPVLGGLRLLGEEAGAYDGRFGLALFAGSMVVALVALSLAVARGAAAHEAARADAERDALRAQRQLEAFVAHVPAPVFLHDTEGRFLLANQACTAGLGSTWEAMEGRTLQEVLADRPPEVLEQALQTQRTVLETRQALSYEQRATIAGEERHFAVTRFPVVDDAGRLSGVGAVTLDVTASRKAEQALAAERALLREAEAIGGLGSYRVDLGTGRLECSPEFLRMFEADESEVADGPQLLWERVAPEHREHLLATSARLREDGAHFDEVYDLVLPSGRRRTVHARGRREGDPAEGPASVVVVLQDVTEREELLTRLAAATSTLRAVLDHSPTAIYLKDDDQRFLLANAETARILGQDELEGRSLHDLLPPDVVADLAENDHAVLAGGVAQTFEERAPDAKDGTEHTWWAVKFPVVDDAGTVLGIGGVSLDVTDRKRAEAARHVAEERFRVAFHSSGVGMSLVGLDGDARGVLLDVNPAYGRMLGHDAASLVGRPLAELVHPDDVGASLELTLERLAAGEIEAIEVERRYVHADGHVVSTLVTNAIVPQHDGTRVVVGQVVDISERKRFEGQLRHLADHDPLTGLYNRRRFADDLDSAIGQVQRYGRPAAVLALDLDGFKYVNDTLGHAAGDELVTRLGTALGRTVRETDIVARTGGDEFAVILHEADEDAAGIVADKLLLAIRRAGLMQSGAHQAQVTCSIGITLLEPTIETTSEDVLIEADIAMYAAKAAGKDCFSVFRRDAGAREHMAVRQSWLHRLRRAVDEDLFVLHAQPVVPICSNGVPRFELLLRLKDDDGSLVLPGTFLYNAERFGLIEQIDHWVLSQAVQLLHHNPAIALSVNLSAKSLNAGNVAPLVAELMERWPVQDGRLVVELTETAAISNMDQARELARDLRALGCRIALDDFGAGFATFYYLKHLDFDYVKIDGEFIKHLCDDRADQLVVRSVVDIARGLGADTVAEFVQDDATIELLRSYGVGYAQGYHTGRPGPLDQVLPAVVGSRGV